MIGTDIESEVVGAGLGKIVEAEIGIDSEFEETGIGVDIGGWAGMVVGIGEFIDMDSGVDIGRGLDACEGELVTF